MVLPGAADSCFSATGTSLGYSAAFCRLHSSAAGSSTLHFPSNFGSSYRFRLAHIRNPIICRPRNTFFWQFLLGEKLGRDAFFSVLLAAINLPRLGPILAPSGPMLAPLGASFSYLGLVLAPCWPFLAHVGLILGSSWPFLGPFWPHLGPSWRIFLSSWPHHRPILAFLGPCWTHLGALSAGVAATQGFLAVLLAVLLVCCSPFFHD